MKFTIHYQTDEYRGSHAAEVEIAFVPKDGETVEELVARVDKWASNVLHHKGMKATDIIALRRVQEVEE